MRNRIVARVLRALGAVLVCWLVAGNPLCKAQIDTGRILGTVRDSSGAVVPGAKVTLTNEGTGFTLTTITGSSGQYVFPALNIGSYTASVQLQGFQRATRVHMPVHVQEDVLADFVLVPGKVTQAVEVKAATPLLQTQNASRGQTIGNSEVNDLPLNGRNWTELAQLVAGVTVQAGNAPQTGGAFSANGIRGGQNDFRLNGIDNNNEFFFAGQNYTILPPPDAIQEFKVQTNDYSAEFGQSAGAVVNATIKSGTNRLLGDAWEFVRNDKLDAAQFFENATGTPKGEFRLNQFGFTLGGPVDIPHVYNGRNKTFFFFEWQGVRTRSASPFQETVPTATMRNSGYANLQDLILDQSGKPTTDDLGRTFPLGTVLDPATTRNVTKGKTDPLSGLPATATGQVRDPFYQGSLTGVMNFTSPAAIALLNMLPAGRLDPNAIKLLNLYPAPTGSGFLQNFVYDPVTLNDSNQFDARIDHNFSAQDQIFGVVDWENNPFVNPSPLPGLADGHNNDGYSGNFGHDALALSETHLFSSTMINEARFGYNRNPEINVNPTAATMGIPAQFGIQGIPQIPNNGGLPNISIGGLQQLGTHQFTPTIQRTQVYDATENLTKVKGRHTIKAGIQFDHIRAWIIQPTASHGHFGFSGTYTSVPNQLDGNNVGIAQLLLTPVASTVPGGYNNVGGADNVSASNFSATDDQRNYVGLYFNDDWRLSQKLTLNLGLRWDYFTPYWETYGAQGNFIPAAPGSAEFLLPKRRCNEPLSTSFTTLLQTDGIAFQCASGLTLGNGQKTNFAPRVGFAYQLLPKLVVRAGYGIFYGALDNIGFGPNLGRNYPFLFNFGYSSPNPYQPITFPNGSIATLENGLSAISFTPANVVANGLGLNARQYNFLTPYTEAYNFTLQYQLTPSQTVDIAYVGSGGRHLDTDTGANEPSIILPPGQNPQKYVPFPDFLRRSTYETTQASSYYNSLQVTYRRQLSQGLSLLADYTYSKCRDDDEPLVGGAGGGNNRAPYLPGFGIQGDYHLCSSDVTHIVHVAGSYQLPFGAGRRFLSHSSGAANQLLGGWSINAVLSEQGGQPFTIGCPKGTTSDFGCNALLVPGQNMYSGLHDVNQWLNPAAFAQPPAATIIGQTDYTPLGGQSRQAYGPGIHRLDFSLFKQFRLSEATHLEFRTEVFNLTNTPMFGQPGFLNFNNTPFSKISSLRDGAFDPREIQLALKLYW
ncbi:MAG TPA: TonB-dependent receptor [Terriglobia bacterium]|nr:TonB-dependent receptor [Terriglobia bacterium]